MTTRPRRTQAERSAETIRALLDAAAAIIREAGAPALATERVAARAGVSKGALLHHFPTRAALIEAVVADIATRVEAEIARQVAAGKPFALAVIDETVAMAAADPETLGALASAVTQDRALAAMVGARTADWAERMIGDGVSEADAFLVRYALDGVIHQCLMGNGAMTDARRLDSLGRRLKSLIGLA